MRPVLWLSTVPNVRRPRKSFVGGGGAVALCVCFAMVHVLSFSVGLAFLVTFHSFSRFQRPSKTLLPGTLSECKLWQKGFSFMVVSSGCTGMLHFVLVILRYFKIF